ncbi:hypothetical protein MXM51_22060 [Pantoea stewartii]|uniref:hypothetical protein n=1 Tax=Pantoea stewartii TaxID=66269 RepID=UPI002DB95C4E|nr:hypothetical protein [Pantoea stewartii]MEB6537197.1 hypothetical protein [Pantoea stewartii]
MTTNHKIYTRLVKSKSDYVGMIAYSIYKREKLAKINKKQDVASFVALKQNNTELNRYREEAESIFSNALEILVKEKLEERNEHIKNNIHLLVGVKENKFLKWHNSGAAGIFGNIYTFILSAVIVYIFSSKEGWKAAAESAHVFFKSVLNMN